MLNPGSFMSSQTKAINILSLVVAMTSAFCGSKYTERLIMLKNNEDFIRSLNLLSSEASNRWKLEREALMNQVHQLKKLISSLEDHENERIASKLENERISLHNKYETAVSHRIAELEHEMHSFQSSLNEKVGHSQTLLSDIEHQLNERLVNKSELKRLEKISQMIIEDNIEGQFNNCFSLNTLRSEFSELLPLIRQYYLINHKKMTLFNFYLSRALAHLMFPYTSMQRFDVLAELNTNVEKGDLKRALFLFNNLKGWPRLLLKDWAEKCRMRLEFIQEIKSQIYLNKI